MLDMKIPFKPENKNTKIICTIGPASWDQEVMRKMIENGMNVARVNGAFADPDELDKVRNLVRNVSEDVGLMVDIKGPEVRLNKFPNPIKVEIEDTIIIGNNDSEDIYTANYQDLYKSVEEGQRILVGDGDVELILEEVKEDKMITTVKYGKEIKPGKAINLPGCDYSKLVMTEKDKTNLAHGIKTGWTSVSASFIQNAKSAQTVRNFINENSKDIPEKDRMELFAKIEDRNGIINIKDILEVVDGIMIARGGLGVELGLEKVPLAQRILINECNEANVKEITATQMLESMTDNPRPTRAEVNDVATAVLHGTDFVMLSSESAAGKYPIEAVEWLTKIILETETLMSYGYREFCGKLL